MAHHAWIDVRQQAGFFEDETSDFRQIGQGRGMPEIIQRLPRRAIAHLRFVAEREQRFLAARLSASPGHGKNFIPRHVSCHALARRLRKRAVVANIATKMSQRDENLA